MAEGREDRSREDLTEEATPFRIEESRRKGMVAQSKELSSLFAFLAAAVATYAMSPKLGYQLTEFMKEVFRTDLSSRADLGSIHFARTYFMKALGILASIGIPVCAAGFIFGALGSFMQVGAIFSVDPITPDLEKINPIQGLQRLFSVKILIEGARLVLKIVAITAVSYYLVKYEIMKAPTLFEGETGFQFLTYGRIAKAIFFALSAILAVFSVIDFAYQRFEYNKNLRMTKQEAKQEHKEREGDPQIRARIRSIQREMARRRMMQAVKKADVIVTNPTHIAVALVYEKSSMNAPKVVAKGADFVAQKIKQIATDAGVPLVENVALARSLYKNVKVGQGIPRNLYQAVAEVLAYVYRLKKRTST